MRRQREPPAAPPHHVRRLLNADSPPGYVHAVFAGRGDAVCLADVVHAVAEAIAGAGTLYAYAERHPDRRAFHGRAPTYAVPLPQGAGEVVVRHAWHGGALRRVTRDVYLPPTRAPRELRTSERLRAAGVRTPRVVAYARYPAPLGLRRVDVATRLVPGARDLADVLLPAPGDEAAVAALRAGWLEATAELLATLARAGARHPDLNLKNVLLARDDAGRPRAWALDLDVVRLPDDGSPAQPALDTLLANLARLVRSLTKWRHTRGLPLGDVDLDLLARRAVEMLDLGPGTSVTIHFHTTGSP